MTTNRRRVDHVREQDAAIDNLRASGEGTPDVIGYKPGSEKARSWPGDDRFPFVKDPPDLLGPYRYIAPAQVLPSSVSNPIPFIDADAANLLALDDIDVSGWRLLRLDITYYQADPTGRLLLIIDGRREATEGGDPQNPVLTTVPVGVLDNTLLTQNLLPGGNRRRVHASELVIDIPAGTLANPITTSLTFGVEEHRTVRFRVGDLVVATSGLDLFYTLGR